LETSLFTLLLAHVEKESTLFILAILTAYSLQDSNFWSMPKEWAQYAIFLYQYETLV